MTECKHGTELEEADCMNCEDEITEFDRWWENESGWGGEKLAEYNLAKEAWFKAIQYIYNEGAIGL